MCFHLSQQKDKTMEAAKLVHVQDRLDLGTDPLAALAGSAGSGKTVTSATPGGTNGSTPPPSPAQNSGTKLPGSEVDSKFAAEDFGVVKAGGKDAAQTSTGIAASFLSPSFSPGMSGDGKLYAKSVASVVPPSNDTKGADFEPRG